MLKNSYTKIDLWETTRDIEVWENGASPKQTNCFRSDRHDCRNYSETLVAPSVSNLLRGKLCGMLSIKLIVIISIYVFHLVLCITGLLANLHKIMIIH